MRFKTQSGMDLIVAKCCDHMLLVVGDESQAVISRLTNSEAIEIAAELVKLAMPDAKPGTAPVSIM